MNTKTTPATPANGLKTIVLLKPHKDAGIDLQPGAELTLPPAVAEWLVEVGTAEFK